jgi:DNA-binding CsgD family transcriptional regulator
MKSQYNSLDLRRALGNQNYLILDNKYKQELSNHPLVKNLWAIGHFFVIVANIYTLKIELVCGQCEEISGFTAEEIEALNGEFLFSFGLPEDIPFNMAVTKIAMEYMSTRMAEERELIMVVYFYRARKKDNKVITIQHQAIPLYLDEKNIPFIISNIITDVSYLGIANVPHALVINRFTDEVFHIEPNNIELAKAKELFSTREREIIKLLFQGSNSRVIAGELCISQETVRTHRKNILKKARVNSTSQLIGYSITHGLI